MSRFYDPGHLEAGLGALSFTAKLTTGAGPEPTRDLFEFKGLLKTKTLTGTLRLFDGRNPSAPVSQESVKLERRGGTLSPLASTYAEWKRQIDGILKFRGPKW